MLPIRPSGGKVSTHEIAFVFASGCLPDFDDVDATLRNLRNAGLTTKDEIEWDAGENGLRSDSKGLFAFMGLVRYGEKAFGNACGVRGEVTDPESNPISALQAIVPGLAFDEDGTALVARDRGKLMLRIRIGAAELRNEVPALDSDSVSAQDVGNPEFWKGAYRYWGPVFFTVDWTS
jgi:hypothetical protein